MSEEREPWSSGTAAVILASITLSVVGGIATSYLPWGDPEGLHGKGFPIPLVIWTVSETSTDELVDHPFPYAIFLNPLVYFVLMMISLGIGKLICRLFRKGDRIGSNGED